MKLREYQNNIAIQAANKLTALLLPIDGMPDRENAHGFICR